MNSFKTYLEAFELDEARKTWKKIQSYLLGKPTTVYTNDSGYTFGKVDGKWVMVDFDDKVIHTGKSAADMKRHFDSWLSEEAPANATGPAVDMNPTGKPKKMDKRSKYHVEKMYRRNKG